MHLSIKGFNEIAETFFANEIIGCLRISHIVSPFTTYVSFILAMEMKYLKYNILKKITLSEKMGFVKKKRRRVREIAR